MAEKMTIDQFDAWRASCVNEPGTYTSYLRGYQDAEAELDELRAKSGQNDSRLKSESSEDIAQWLYANGHQQAAATVRGQLDIRNNIIRELRAKVARLKAPVGDGDIELFKVVFAKHSSFSPAYDGCIKAALTAFLANRSNGK